MTLQQPHHHQPMSLQALFKPRSVAIVGASENPHKIGGRPVDMLKRLGFSGAVYPVNPHRSVVQGLRCYPCLADLPEAPDVVIVAVPAASVEAVVHEAIAIGARSLIVFSSGFAETGTQADQACQDRIARVLRAKGIPMLGPNCLGVIDIRSAFTGTFSPAPLGGLADAGSVGIISQSGAVGAYLYFLAKRAGLGLSTWVTTGNEAVLTTSDALLALVADPNTRVILLFIEGVRDGRKLRLALGAARSAGKVVVVCKVGRTKEGARAAQSHTASLAGEDAVYTAVFDQTGAMRASNLHDMILYGRALSKPVLPSGRSIAIVTVSGGIGTLMADAAIEAGLTLPPLPEASIQRLKARVPFGAALNPIDVTAQINTDHGLLEVALEEVVASERYAGLVLFLVVPRTASAIADALTATISRFRERHPEVPIYLSGIFDEANAARLSQIGATMFEDPTEAVRVFAALAQWHTSEFGFPEESVPPATFVPNSHAATLSEVECLNFFAQSGLTCVPYEVVNSPSEAVEAWTRMGRDVVLKIVSRDILHKSDVGGVRVELRDSRSVLDAYEYICKQVRLLAPHAQVDGMLLARTLYPRVEVILGARWDEAFGLVLLIGQGGTAVELHQRTATLALPIGAALVERKLDELGILRLLGPWRGRRAIDPAALVAYVLSFARLATSLEGHLESMEINPLMVTEEGVFAADGVLMWRSTSGDAC